MRRRGPLGWLGDLVVRCPLVILLLWVALAAERRSVDRPASSRMHRALGQPCALANFVDLYQRGVGPTLTREMVNSAGRRRVGVINKDIAGIGPRLLWVKESWTGGSGTLRSPEPYRAGTPNNSILRGQLERDEL